MKPRKVTVIGAGAWGTALAAIAAAAGHESTLLVRRAEHLKQIIDAGENSYLPGVPLPKSLKLSNCGADSLGSAEIIIVAVPSEFFRAVVRPLAANISDEATLVSATKGIEHDSLMSMTSVLSEIAPGRPVAALSGPGFAAEIARGLPAALIVASSDPATAKSIQQLLSGRALRVYSSDDVTGVELGGAVKNVIAIAAGICDGLKLGSSARAALVTRGLAEIMRLGRAMGARLETIAGLSGLGDLVLTCTGELSRNRAHGFRLASAESPSAEGTASVAEGVPNAKSIRTLARKHKVEMPIVEAVYACLYEERPPKAMVERLLSRDLKSEY